MNDQKQAALDYHEFPTPGKISVTPTKQLVNQSDLALAYSPGVAAACQAIVEDPLAVFRYTARGNLVGVITNGSAVLGLGAIGPLAAKPVMEGKAVLFKKFAGIDVFDIEIEQSDPVKLIEAIAALEPTFGAINLEDIKAPECFIVERELRARMKIPVFHDDQHGTAIIVGAAIINGLKVVEKDIRRIKLVVSGAGAAALACVDLLLDLGLPRENIWLSDLAGVVYEGRRELMDPHKARFAQPTDARSLADIIAGADVFLGLSAGGVLTAALVKKMARAAADPRPGQSAAGDPSGGGAGRPPGRRDRNGAQRLPESGEQCAVLSVHFPRRAGRRRHHHHALDGNSGRARDRGARPPGAERRRRGRLRRHRGPELRSAIPHSQAVRSAADRQDRTRGRQSCDGVGRRDAADRGLRCLPQPPRAVRLSQRHADAADLRRRAQGRARAQPHRVRRGRGRTGAARRADRGRREGSRPRSWWAVRP